MVSLIWEKRAIPLSWSLLPKRGSSNVDEQSEANESDFTLIQRLQNHCAGRGVNFVH
jgi:hypothetical protein